MPLKLFVDQLFDFGAFEVDAVNRFALKHVSEPSPYILNRRTPDNPGRRGPLTPPLLREMAKYLVSAAYVRGWRFNAVAGVPNAGVPIAEAFRDRCHALGERYPLVRLEEHDGVMAVADFGHSVAGDYVLLIDDVATGGHDKLRAITALCNDGFAVRHALVVIDREQGAARLLQSQEPPVELGAVLGIRHLLELRGRKLSAADRAEVLAYLKRQRERIPAR